MNLQEAFIIIEVGNMIIDELNRFNPPEEGLKYINKVWKIKRVVGHEEKRL